MAPPKKHLIRAWIKPRRLRWGDSWELETLSGYTVSTKPVRGAQQHTISKGKGGEVGKGRTERNRAGEVA